MELRSFSFGLPVDGLRIGSLGASSFGTKQWWKDFSDYWFEGVRIFDPFIWYDVFVYSFFYSVFILFFLWFLFLVVQPPSLEGVCWNLLVASSAAARISDGLTRRFVYACYLDVDIVYCTITTDRSCNV